ncbi:MAG: amino acid adenylation domain-containing protein [Oscillatoria sp. PMC 1051.18]|nr:amino acid adenylation domain-containing protein [Oscillatoria sp. PMC 1051.18]
MEWHLKMNFSLGIRSLTLSFPETIRTNAYWRENFPHLLPKARKRQRKGVIGMGNESSDIWSQAVAPYLDDPFRGARERRILLQEESGLALECRGAKEAIALAGLAPEDIDLALVSALFPDCPGPGHAAYLSQAIGLRCPAWSIESTCSSTLVALETARAFIEAETYQTILIVVSHLGSNATDNGDSLSWSLGDGVGAFVVSPVRDNRGILGMAIAPTTETCDAYRYELANNCKGKPQTLARTGDNAIALAETAVKAAQSCCQKAAQVAGVNLAEIDFFAFNTPTAWYANVCARALGIDSDRVLNLYPRYGNIGPVFPFANLYHAIDKNKLKDGDLVLVYSNGAAATAAAAVLRWGKTQLGTPPAPPLAVSEVEERVEKAMPLQIASASLLPLSSPQVLSASPDDQLGLLKTYLLDWLAIYLQCSQKELSGDLCLGGLLDSLVAIELKRRLETDFHISIPLRWFFGDNDINHLANNLLNRLVCKERDEEQAAEETFSALPTPIPDPSNRYKPFPLTDLQHAYWVGRLGVLELGNVANHGYYEIEGEGLDVGRLNSALRRLIDRHDMLRAIILADGRQQVLETVPPYEIAVLDLQEASPDEVERAIAAIRQQLSHQVLPTDRWPLFEFRATQLPGKRVRLHISYDLQIFDAWSLFRLFEEWYQLYSQPETTFPPLEITFRDCVLTEQKLEMTSLYRRSRDYWLTRLDTLPPAPELPLAKHPSEIKQPQIRRYDARLNRQDWQKLRQNAREAGVTPSVVLLTAFSEVVKLWSKNPNFTLNLALFNRLPFHPQVNELIGDFTSSILLSVHSASNHSFRDRAIAIQEQLWQDLEHRYFSGVRVTRELARVKGTTPNTLPIIFTSTLGMEALGQETSSFSHFGELVYAISQVSQGWMDVQIWEEKGELTFNWDVVEELFPQGLIAEMFAAYCRLLELLATSATVWQEKQLVLPPTQLALYDKINRTDAPISETLLHELFAIRVRERANQPAVIAPQLTLTYQELFNLSNQLARRLQTLGASRGRLVAVVMEKGWEQIVAVLGILASGAAYVPIDPAWPEERRQALLTNSEACLILTQSRLDETLSWPAEIIRLCVDRDKLTEESSAFLPAQQTPDDLAYLIYTSGSTGFPKGVAIAHRSAVNTIEDINRRFGIGAGDRVLALSSLSFDLSVYDIFGILAAGGAVVLPEARRERDPRHWADLLHQQNITLWNSVPALMQMMVDSAKDLGDLRLVLLSGDWIPLALPGQIQTLNREVEIVSLGGATEASIWSICYPIKIVDSTGKSIPYGRPLANQRFYVLDEELEPRPFWVPGQLYIGGIGLAREYWRNEEKTTQSFITHPKTGERLYKTGDWGRYLPDGNIEFLGREDYQVKVNGYRIELGEIEAVLTQYSQVKQAVVDIIGNEVRNKRIVAYVVSNKGEITLESLRHFLSDRLPDYMIPSAFVFLDALPLSANGKVNRPALPVPDSLTIPTCEPNIAPQDSLEQTIATIWQEVLEIEQIGVNRHFFDLGGNSLLLTRMYGEILKQLPDLASNLTIVELFNYSTIRQLSQYLSGQNNPFPAQAQEVETNEALKEGRQRLKQRYKQSIITN